MTQKDGLEVTPKKIMVQHRHTKAYVVGDDKWSGSALLARAFESPYHALHFCVEKELRDTDVVFRLADNREVRFLRC